MAAASLIVIEHNLDVIKSADWVIDLGPEGGEEGGRIVAEGTPEEIASNLHSYTGKWLARIAMRASGLPSHDANAQRIPLLQLRVVAPIAEIPGSRPAAQTGKSQGS